MGRYVCPKCNGQGHIDCYKYMAGGVCFMCNGSGRVDRKPVERKPRATQTYEQKQAAAARKEASIIASEYADTIKRINQAIEARGELIIIWNSLRASYEAMPKSTIGQARTASELTMRYLYRLGA